MFYLKNTLINTIIINKSKFICTIIPITSISDAENNLKKLREQYFDATHNCYAYLLGDNWEIQKCSDDGEPQKTAGFPMLDALKKKQVTNVLAVVTRYFGGILLGASGLIRAYSQAVLQALDTTNLATKTQVLTFTLVCDYKEYNMITKLIYLTLNNVSFQTEVIIEGQIDLSQKARLIKDLENILKTNVNLNFLVEDKII